MSQTIPPSGSERRDHARSGLRKAPLDAVYGLARWLVGHAHGLYTALGAFLLVGLAAATLATAAFALVAERMAGGATQAFDEAVVAWTRANTSPFLDGLAILGAALGSGMATWIVLGVGSAALWFSRHHLSVLLLWIALVGGRWLSTTLKQLFDRPRPRPVEWDLEVFGSAIHFPSSPSFPSGHAVTSVIIFGTLAYLIMRLEPTVLQRRLTLGAAAALILLIGLSRIYLGVHYPSDVLAGFLAGFIWVSFAAFSIEVIRYFAVLRPEIAREEKDLEKGLRPIRETLEGEPGR
jgi:membrane-associated phospholipid phosphatase